MQGAGNKEDNVVDHVAVGDVVQKGGKRLDGLLAEVVELCHQFLLEPLVNGGHGQGAGLVGEEVAVIRRCQMQLEVWGDDMEEAVLE